MSDADKLRELAKQYTKNIGLKIPELVAWRDDLNRIASLLDAIPSETLEAIRLGTWQAVPKEPNKGQHRVARNYFGMNPFNKNGGPMDELWLAAYRAMLGAAPEKPEGT